MQRFKEVAKTHGQLVLVLTAFGTAVTTAVLDRFFPEGEEAAKKSHEAVSGVLNANTKAIEEAVADLDDALMREKERRRMVERRIRDLEERICAPGLGAPVASSPVRPEVVVEAEESTTDGEAEVAVEVPQPKPARIRVGARLRAAVKQAPDFEALTAD